MEKARSKAKSNHRRDAEDAEKGTTMEKARSKAIHHGAHGGHGEKQEMAKSKAINHGGRPWDKGSKAQRHKV